MTRYLLDTCVLSEWTRPVPNPKFLQWMSLQKTPEALFISTITLGEIQKGIAKLGDSEKAKKLQLWLDHDVQAWFDGRILSFDSESATLWGKLTAECEKHGNSRSTLDSMIAAIAIQHHLILVSRNIKDMTGMGLALLNPWDEDERET